MQINAEEEKAGMAWLAGAGLAAIVLTWLLFSIDNRLSTSDYDRELGATLKELRTAQASLASKGLDARVYVHSAAVTDND